MRKSSDCARVSAKVSAVYIINYMSKINVLPTCVSAKVSAVYIIN
jgi:hypothetical protein